MGRYLSKSATLRAVNFDASGSLSVPSDIVGDWVYVTGVGPGAGGCSGAAKLLSGTVYDYANGGGAGMAANRVPVRVVPGETLTITIGTAGTGGAAITQTAQATTDGNAGTSGTATTISRSGSLIFALQPGTAPTFTTGGRGTGVDAKASSGITIGGDGGDNTANAEYVGPQPGTTDGTDSGLAVGGHGGGASAYGRGGNGGNGDIDTSTATATAGEDAAGPGGGGGGGGAAIVTGTSGTAISGAGGDGGDSYLLIEYYQDE